MSSRFLPFAVLILLIGAFSFCEAYEFDPFDRPIAGKDHSGVVWVSARKRSTLIRCDDTRREIQTFNELGHDAYLVRFASLPNGSLAGLWQTSPDEIAITEHHGNTSEVVARGRANLHGPINDVPPIEAVDARGRFWFSDRQGTIRYYDSLTHKIFDVYILDQASESKKRFQFIHLVPISEDRVIAYRSGKKPLHSPDFFVFDAPTQPPRPVKIKEDEPLQLVSVIPFQNKLLAAAEGHDQLFLIDPDTAHVEKIPSPEPRLFTTIRCLRLLNGEAYIYTCNAANETSLWRLDASRKLTLLSRFPMGPPTTDFALVADTLHPANLFLLNYNVYHIKPDETKPVWREGEKPFNTRFLFPHSKPGEYFTVSESDSYIGPLPLTREGKLLPEPRDGNTTNTTGIAGEIWELKRQDSDQISLRNWDGRKWNIESYQGRLPFIGRVDTLTCDDFGRVWLFHGSGEQATAIFYPEERRWEAYPTLRDAFEATRRIPYRTRFPMPLDPIYSRKGKIAYLSPKQELFFFDGARWHSWKKTIMDEPIDSAPFFENEETLSMILNETKYRFEGSKGWVKSKDAPPPRRVPASLFELPFRTHFTFRHATRITRDESGNLRGYNQPPIPTRASSKTESPFSAFRRPAALSFTERRDGTITVTDLTPPHPNPTPDFTPSKAEVRRLSKPDRIEVSMPAETATQTSVRWRLDSGPWRRSKPGERVIIAPIIGGKHQITLQTEAKIDLLTSPYEKPFDPITLDFEIPLAPRDQLPGLIGSLKSNSQRERLDALEALVQIPELAIPALEREQSRTTRSLLWWVDLAIEQCKIAAHHFNSP